jgi:hypothetical protein
MLGWLLLGRASGRRAERRRLEEQAERQRLRAPEPGPQELAERLRDHGAEARAVWGLARWVAVPILSILAVTVDPLIFWIGLPTVIAAAATYLGLCRA